MNLATTSSERKIPDAKSSVPAAVQLGDQNIPLRLHSIIKALGKLDQFIATNNREGAEQLARQIMLALESGIPTVDQNFSRNRKGREIVQNFKNNRFDQGTRNELILFLRKYSRVILYCYDPSNVLLQPEDDTHWYASWAGRISAWGGAIFGEARSVVFQVFSFITNHSAFVAALGSNFQNITSFLSKLPALSYFFYGASALCYFIKAIVVLVNSDTPNENGLPQAHRYKYSGRLSAAANFAVFALYFVVGAILYGSTLGLAVLGVAAMKTGIAMAIAAVGTLVSWLGNECIASYRAHREHREAGDLQKDFPERKADLEKAKNEKWEECIKADRHKRLGIYMVIGMVLMAFGCFTPVLPFLSIPMLATFPSITPSVAVSFLSLAFFIGYASDGIRSVTSTIWDKVASCCCNVDDAVAAGPSQQPRDEKTQAAANENRKHNRSDSETSLKRNNSVNDINASLGRQHSRTLGPSAILAAVRQQKEATKESKRAPALASNSVLNHSSLSPAAQLPPTVAAKKPGFVVAKRF